MEWERNPKLLGGKSHHFDPLLNFFSFVMNRGRGRGRGGYNQAPQGPPDQVVGTTM
jgi:hypothetical protein